MLDAIKHITDDIFSFRKTVHRCIRPMRVTVQLSEKCDFRVSPTCQVVQKHKLLEVATVKRLFIAYFIGNISAKKI